MNWVPSAPSLFCIRWHAATQALELRHVLRVTLSPDRQAMRLPDVSMGLHDP